MSEISPLKGLPEISFIDWLTLQETEELLKGWYTQKFEEVTGKTPSFPPAADYTLELKAIALLGYQILQFVDWGGKRALLKYAFDDDLDVLAGNSGLVRKGEEKATVMLQFTLADVLQPGAVAIPAGTRARTQDGIYFRTKEYAEIAPGEKSVDTTAQAVEAGKSSSGIAEGRINQLVDPIPYVAGVVNVSASSGGTDVESDDSLTERVYLVPSTYGCAGSEDAYRYIAKTWRNDVQDVEPVSPAPCTMDIYFTLAGGELPSEADCKAMKEYIELPGTRRPMTDLVTCRAPEEVGYNINVKYTIAQSKSKTAVTIQSNINQAIEEFKTWQRTMGRDIDPAELNARIKNAGAKKVKIIEPADAAVGKAQIAKLVSCEVVYEGIEDD